MITTLEHYGFSSPSEIEEGLPPRWLRYSMPPPIGMLLALILKELETLQDSSGIKHQASISDSMLSRDIYLIHKRTF